jgi:hypothetical protein
MKSRLTSPARFTKNRPFTYGLQFSFWRCSGRHSAYLKPNSRLARLFAQRGEGAGRIEQTNEIGQRFLALPARSLLSLGVAFGEPVGIQADAGCSVTEMDLDRAVDLALLYALDALELKRLLSYAIFRFPTLVLGQLLVRFCHKAGRSV